MTTLLTPAELHQRQVAGIASGAARRARHPTMTMLIGPPASGKSTWQQQNRPKATVISTDKILEDEGSPITPANIDRATKVARRQFRAAAAAGHDIVVDRTNPTLRSRDRWLSLLPDHYVRHAVVFDTHPAERAWRIRQRDLAGKGVQDPRLRAVVPTEPPAEGEFDHVETVSQPASRHAQAWARRGRHLAETTPSVRQGSSGAPSKSAIGLFRQGQARPDTRARRGVWDTRTSEAPVGAINATFRFHFPQAYRSATPDVALSGDRKSLALSLAAVQAKRKGRRKPEPERHRDLTILNPGAIVEAHLHPAMREITTRTIGVVRDHQKATIERAMERGMIPAGTHPGTVLRAYKHAALRAMHKAGLGDYRTNMDRAAMAEFQPLRRFMYYAHRRVFDHLNQPPLQGKWQPFREEFGELYRQKKYGKYTGVERMRMRPGDQFIKLGDLDGDLAKGFWGRAAWRAAGQFDALHMHLERIGRRVGRKLAHATSRDDYLASSKSRPKGSKIDFGIHIGGRAYPALHYAGAGLATGAIGGGATGYALGHRRGLKKAMSPPHRSVHGLRAGVKIPEPPGGIPRIGGAHLHVKHAAIAVERHFRVPRIGGMTRKQADGTYIVQDLNKMDLSFTLGSDPYASALGNYNTDPERQLRRAMRPRMRRRIPRLRLNTQRHLRRVLSGGITHQERWQLGATARPLASPYQPVFKAAPWKYVLAGAGGGILGAATGAHLAGRRASATGAAVGGEVGATAGETLGALYGGPVGGAAGGLVGGTAGSFIGSKFGPKARMRRRQKLIGIKPMLKRYDVTKHPREHDGKFASKTGERVGRFVGGGAAAAGGYLLGQKHGERLAVQAGRGGGVLFGRLHDRRFGMRAHMIPSAAAERAEMVGGTLGRHLGGRYGGVAGAALLGMGGFLAGSAGGSVLDRWGARRRARRAGKLEQWQRLNAKVSIKPGSRKQVKRAIGTAIVAGKKIQRVHQTMSSILGKSDLEKGIIGDAIRFGATQMPKIAGAARRGFAAAKPVAARAFGEAKSAGWKGMAAPANLAGRVAGAAIGHPKAVAALGGAGLAADYLPTAYTAGRVTGVLGDKPKPPKPPSLRKNLFSSGLRAVGGPRGAAMLAGGAGAGLAAAPVARAWHEHPRVRQVAGALAAGTAAAVITRGHARAGVVRAARRIYQTGLRDAVREHVRVMQGGTPSPHHLAESKRALEAARHVARSAAMARKVKLFPHKGVIAGAALAGGYAADKAHMPYRSPPLSQLAEQPTQ